jgi:hypothetical protein
MSRAVNRTRLIFSLLAAMALNGCATSYTNNIFTRNRNYRKVRVTDLQGYLIAEYIAEGNVWRRGKGYRFKAMQRTVGGPLKTTARYPQGRIVRVDAPNIVVMPCGKPRWLYEIDGF